jgi:hypothetical protein
MLAINFFLDMKGGKRRTLTRARALVMAASAWTCFMSAFFNSVEPGSAPAGVEEEEPKKDIIFVWM